MTTELRESTSPADAARAGRKVSTDPAASAESTQVLFHAGGLALAVPARLVQYIHDDLAVQAVAGTADWFVGLAVPQGRLLPITDLGAYLLGIPSRGRVLQLHADIGIAGLRVDRVVGIQSPEPSGIEPPSAAVHAGMDCVLARSVLHASVRYHALDLVQLLGSDRFLDVGRIARHSVGSASGAQGQ